MKAKLIELLETFKYPVFLQGSLNPAEAYPDSFFTFWNPSNNDSGFYSGSPIRSVWLFFVYFYSNDPELVATIPEQARQLLKINNFIVQGMPNDISVDRPTHTGAFFETYIFDNYNTSQE